MDAPAFFELHDRLLGEVLQQRLQSAHVTLVGAGGLGCFVADSLVRLGVGTLTIIDDDKVSVSNLPRQILFQYSDLGRSKVEVAKQKLSEKFPTTRVVAIENRLTSVNAKQLLAGSQVVVDCTDNYAARYAISKACHQLRQPMVYGGVKGYEGQVGVFCYKGSPAFHEVFSDIEALAVEENCSDSGVLPFVVQRAGHHQAIEVFKILTGETAHLLINQLYCFNTLSQKHRVIKLRVATQGGPEKL